VSVTVAIGINGVTVPVTLSEAALTAIAEAISPPSIPATSPYMTIAEAAEYLRCSRQRVDDLLSQGRLSRVKEGRRTLVVRADIEAHLRGLKGGDV
jgi:excisionase family DNA binding protein